jgi:hypothetical protein
MLAVLYHPHVSASCRLPFLPGQGDVAGVARHVIVGRIQEKGDEVVDHIHARPGSMNDPGDRKAFTKHEVH